MTSVPETATFLDEIKEMGYSFAFKGGLSFSLGDIIIPTDKQKLIDEANATRKKLGLRLLAKGGLAEATAKLKAKGFKEGGMVVKDKTVAIDKSPNSGLITTKGFGAGRRT